MNITTLAFALAVLLTQAKAAQNGPLRLRVQTLEAIQGGPLVLKATLRNHGKQRVFVSDDLMFGNVKVEAPAKWASRRTVIRFYNGWDRASIALEPGGEFSETVFVHQRFADIPVGSVNLALVWHVSEAETEKTIASLRVPVQVNVQAATQEALLAACKRMEQFALGLPVNTRKIDRVLNEMRYTKHAAFVPLALRLLELRESRPVADSIVHFLYECLDDPLKIHPLLVEYGSDHKSGYTSVFSHWKWKNHFSRTSKSKLSQELGVLRPGS